MQHDRGNRSLKSRPDLFHSPSSSLYSVVCMYIATKEKKIELFPPDFLDNDIILWHNSY